MEVVLLIIIFFFISLLVEGEKPNKHISQSKVSGKESSVSSSSINQEPLAVKEKFIPPELSIWDYFIAKVIKRHYTEVYTQMGTSEFKNKWLAFGTSKYFPMLV